MSYDVGDLVTVQVVITDAAGTPVNTPTVTIAVTKPDGTVLTPAPTVTNTGAGGIYTAPLTLTAAGIWTYVWTSTGTVVGTEAGQVEARAARQLVVALEEFKLHLRFSTTVDDAQLLDTLVAVTDLMEETVGPVAPITFTEQHMVRGRVIVPRRHPLVSVTSIIPHEGAAMAADEYVPDTDLNLIYLSNTYARARHQLVYLAGHNPWPSRLKLAGKIIAQHEWRVRNGTGGRPSPDADSLEMIPGTGYLVPYRALELMRPSLRPMVA